MKRIVLLAHPAGHSLSPTMHNAAFLHLDIPARYEALDVPPKGLPGAVEELRGPEFLGANVSVPHKTVVAQLVDELSGSADTVGAVNTVVNCGGHLIGHNTDGSGFLRGLADIGFDPEGSRVLLLGAGGAAKGVAAALLRAGVSRLAVYNRTTARAVELAETFSHLGPVEPVVAGGLEGSLGWAQLLVNATTVGMEHGVDTEASPLPGGLMPWQGVVVDLIYRPERTRLLRESELAGLVVQNGLPMLVYQGAEAFEIWLGRAAPTETMFAAIQTALL